MATWAKGIDFKNSANSSRVGGVGIYGNDGSIEKAYLAVGQEPWNNTGLEVTSSTITFKGNKVYHAGSKPTPSEIGAAAASHGTHVTYSSTAPLANGTASAGSASTVARTDHVHPLQTTVSGNAGTATKLQTARTISIAGHATGSASFDGSSNVTITATLANSGVTAGSYGPSDNTSSSFGGTISIPEVTVDAKGRVTSATTRTVTLPSNPNSDTKVTNTLNTTTKAYVTGTTSATTNTGTQIFDTGVYLDTTAGRLVATTFAGALSGNATTATTLQTARTINGTSFNGSGNITTSLWGTARNITIGSTKKSVNGSADVSWSLSEIGAAPASHTHSYAPVANGVQRWNSVIKCATWSRIMHLSGHTTVGHSGIINIQGTRANVVFNATFIINTSHSSKAYITQINNTNYSNFQIRAVTNSDGETYVEVYDNANSATNATTQTLNVSYTAISGIGAGTLTKYTAFTDGTAIPTNFAEVHKITTVNGSHYSGNAATATKLQTARTINGTNFDGTSNITTANWGTARNIQIGKTGKSVNGSGNVSWSLSEIGAAAESHTHSGYAASSHTHSSLTGTTSSTIAPSTGTGVLRYDYNVSSTATGNMPNSNNANGIITVNTHSGNYYSQLGFSSNGNLYYRNFNGAALDTTTAWKQIAYTTSSITGNAGTATKLQTARTINGTSFDGTANITTANWGTARTITIGSTGKSVNGSGNVTWTLSEIGAAAASHTHSYVPTSAGGNIIVHADSDSSTTSEYLALKAGHNILQITSSGGGTTTTQGQDKLTFNGNVVYHAGRKPTASEIGAAASSHTHTTVGSYMGISNTTGTNGYGLSLYGGATAGAPSYGIMFQQTGTFGTHGSVTSDWATYFTMAGSTSRGWIFKAGNAAGGNVASISATGVITASSFKGALSGNASTATTLQTARTLTIGNTGKSFNGSGNVSWSLSEIGAAASSHTHNYAGSSSAGGAANTAVKLHTARTISLGGILSGSASFDGSGNVTISAAANDITTITKSLTVTTSWADTGIAGSNLGTGTYAVQMLVNDGTNTSQWSEYYSGIMSWYNSTTNSTDADEILLHKAGHAPNGRHMYLRVQRTGSSGYLKLQISSTHAFTAASSIVFKFKKLI